MRPVLANLASSAMLWPSRRIPLSQALEGNYFLLVAFSSSPVPGALAIQAQPSLLALANEPDAPEIQAHPSLLVLAGCCSSCSPVTGAPGAQAIQAHPLSQALAKPGHGCTACHRSMRGCLGCLVPPLHHRGRLCTRAPVCVVQMNSGWQPHPSAAQRPGWEARRHAEQGRTAMQGSAEEGHGC
eukprot:1149195-Pelagomonas_calceolata.AAC.2